MIRLFRAAAFAAAALFAIFGAFYAGPSRAWESDSPATGTYLDHLSAGLDTPDPSINPPASTPAEPIVPAPAAGESARRPLAELVDDHSRSEADDAQHECLAVAVYFEAKGESLEGQLAVAEVVLNRAGSGRFPSTVCGVVKQRAQFSFVRGGRFPPIPRASAAWRKAVAIAYIARQELAEGAAPRALFFHARYVSPGWRKLTRVATVGNHIFYR
jgi:spore germination cell wall hydrolase CwlJ-like protein